MKTLILISVFSAGICIGAEKKILIGNSPVLFSPKISQLALRKKVVTGAKTYWPAPYETEMAYDSSQLKVARIDHQLTTADSVSADDLGILSRKWGVKEGDTGRYLNISDLKKMGLKQIGIRNIVDWIICGTIVGSNPEFRKLYGEAKKIGMVKESLPPKFEVSEQKIIQGQRYLSVTVLVDFNFIKFHYLVSPESEIMLVKYDKLIVAKPPELIPNSGSPGQFYLKNPGDSTVLKRQLLYRDLTDNFLKTLN